MTTMMMTMMTKEEGGNMATGLTGKIESSHQRHNRQHNDANFTSLGSLLGVTVKLSNGIAGEKQQSNLHTQGVYGHPN